MTSSNGTALEPAHWLSSKLGPGMQVGSDGSTVTRSGAGAATAICDQWHSKDITTVQLTIEQAGGDVFVGVVGRNYLHADWSEPLQASRHGVLLEVGTGRLFYKGSRLDFPMLMPLRVGTRLNMVIDCQQQALTLQVLAADGVSIAMDVTLEGEKRIPAEVAACVSFGPGGSGVRLVGSVTEKPDLKLLGKQTKDLWDDENVIKEDFLNKKDSSLEKQRRALEREASTMGAPEATSQFVRAPYRP